MRLEKEIYHMFLMKIIEKHFPSVSEQVLKEGVLAPLTGHSVGMRTNELLALYAFLCDLFGEEIKLHDVYSFWSIDAIAKLLMEYEDESIRHAIQAELAT